VRQGCWAGQPKEWNSDETLSLAVRRSRADQIKEILPRSLDRVVNDTETAVPDLHKCQTAENLQTRVGAAAFGMFVELPRLFRVRLRCRAGA
jgi:hypothetical protein